MTEENIKIRIRLEVERAEESLKAAKILLQEKLYDESVSSAYYAMLHMTKALLLTVNDEPSTHQGVIVVFGLKFIKTKIIEEMYNDMLINAKESRESGDYDSAKRFTDEEAEEQVENADKFYLRILIYLKDNKFFGIIKPS